jgi:hypothetical protein
MMRVEFMVSSSCESNQRGSAAMIWFAAARRLGADVSGFGPRGKTVAATSSVDPPFQSFNQPWIRWYAAKGYALARRVA